MTDKDKKKKTTKVPFMLFCESVAYETEENGKRVKRMINTGEPVKSIIKKKKPKKIHK